VPTLRRKLVDLPAWHLTDLTQMAAAFTALTTDGWRGGISSDQSGSLRLELNRDDPREQIIAGIGDWLVLDLGLRLISATERADNYDEAGGS
jgi:hypothetical protein